VRPLAASLRALRQVLPDTEPVLVTEQLEMILSCVALTLHTLLACGRALRHVTSGNDLVSIAQQRPIYTPP
jgi:hypothetical protein